MAGSRSLRQRKLSAKLEHKIAAKGNAKPVAEKTHPVQKLLGWLRLKPNH